MTARDPKALLALFAVAVAIVVAVFVGGGDDGNGDRADDARASSSASSTASGSAATAPTDDPTLCCPDAGDAGTPNVVPEALPQQAQDTLALIDAGGPFPYPGKDGSTFLNLEGLLPDHERGYYREYTVPTPGEDDRGARRLVVGRGGETYYTDDHYESFEEVLR